MDLQDSRAREDPAELPFYPPEEVQQMLQPGDWEALERAWSHDWQGMETAGFPCGSYLAETSGQWPEEKKKKKQRPKWDESWSLIGSDSRRPAPQRRYFDAVPAEIRAPVEPVRPDMKKKEVNPRFEEDDRFEALLYGTGWLDCWSQTGSSDNDSLHPLLRHYFDHRGIESSYRQRPTADHPWLQTIPPRTPQRPSARTLKKKIINRATMAPKPPDPGAPAKSIPWGVRCLRYGGDFKAHHYLPKTHKIPWVYDHNRSESEDNPAMNPLLRHYFDADGIESSFRNRGRQFGRPVRPVFGRQFTQPDQRLAAVASLGILAPGKTMQESQSEPSLHKS
ncbi:unnamed protein product [Durusdinium trenchii]|uniref:Uncharacterized protein n=2 Tax=Durusdinium trenchii TaxID=1381693 RepID=A0ABP0NRU5_9DINO